MPEILLRAIVSEWKDAVDALDLRWGRAVLVAGERADITADALARCGAPPIGYSRHDLAVLGDVPAGVDLAAVTATDGLPSHAFDLAVLMHAWSDAASLVTVVDESYRVIRPDGMVVAGELSLDRMRSAGPRQFHANVLYVLFPEVYDEVATWFVETSGLSVALARAGFQDIVELPFVQTLARALDHQTYWQDNDTPMWRGLRGLDAEERSVIESTLQEVLPTLAPSGEVRDREPWLLVRGRKAAA